MRRSSCVSCGVELEFQLMLILTLILTLTLKYIGTPPKSGDFVGHVEYGSLCLVGIELE